MARLLGRSRGSSTLIVPGLLLLFVLPVLGYAVYSVTDRWYQGYRLSQEEAGLRTDITRLREENLKLQAALKDARSDAAIEAVAREQLGLVKPGDRAIVLVGPPLAVAPAKPAEGTTRRPESSEAAGLRQPPGWAAAPRTDPTAERATPPEPGGWRKVLDALFGR